jgi:peptidyl-prolyl cis-trans isomerase SurA
MFALLLAGCGEKEKKPVLKCWTEPVKGLPDPTGGFVMCIADQTISCEQVIGPSLEHLKPVAKKTNYEQFRIQAWATLEQMFAVNVANIILVQQAKKKAGDNIDEQLDKLADAEVQKFVMTYQGDTAKAETALKNMGMDWKTFKEYHKKMMLAQSYIQSQLPENIPIAYHEMLDYYNRTKDRFFSTQAAIQFRLIDIDVAKIDVNDPNENKKQTAMALANQLVENLHQGADFAQLAVKYSNDHRSQFGGLWKPVQPDALAAPYDILGKQAENLQPGQIAGPIDAGEHIFLMKLEDKQTASVEPFEKVQDRIESQIRFDRRKLAADKLSNKLTEQAYVAQKNEFLEFCAEEIYRVSTQ